MKHNANDHDSDSGGQSNWQVFRLQLRPAQAPQPAVAAEPEQEPASTQPPKPLGPDSTEDGTARTPLLRQQACQFGKTLARRRARSHRMSRVLIAVFLCVVLLAAAGC